MKCIFLFFQNGAWRPSWISRSRSHQNKKYAVYWIYHAKYSRNRHLICVPNPYLVPEILLCMVFTLSFGGHLEKRPLAANVLTFERDIGAHFFLNWSRYSNPPSNKGRKKMVTGPQDMTLLIYSIASIWFLD